MIAKIKNIIPVSWCKEQPVVQYHWHVLNDNMTIWNTLWPILSYHIGPYNTNLAETSNFNLKDRFREMAAQNRSVFGLGVSVKTNFIDYKLSRSCYKFSSNFLLSNIIHQYIIRYTYYISTIVKKLKCCSITLFPRPE